MFMMGISIEYLIIIKPKVDMFINYINLHIQKGLLNNKKRNFEYFVFKFFYG